MLTIVLLGLCAVAFAATVVVARRGGVEARRTTGSRQTKVTAQITFWLLTAGAVALLASGRAPGSVTSLMVMIGFYVHFRWGGTKYARRRRR